VRQLGQGDRCGNDRRPRAADHRVGASFEAAPGSLGGSALMRFIAAIVGPLPAETTNPPAQGAPHLGDGGIPTEAVLEIMRCAFQAIVITDSRGS
jgi:hypothetical protein